VSFCEETCPEGQVLDFFDYQPDLLVLVLARGSNLSVP
jgi:hypothetical protein